MELRQLRYFEAVARHCHFTRAAEELLVAQPALSLQIKRMERELGTRLFDRNTHGVWLTEAGEVLLPSARRVLSEAADAEARVRDLTSLETGHISLATQQSLNASGVLPAALRRFRDRYPGVDVVLREENASASLTMLRDGQLDLALVMLDSDDDTELLAEPLFDEQLVFVVGSRHPRAGQAVALAELADEPFIAFNGSAGLRRVLERACLDAGFQPRIGYESDALGSIRAIVAAGLGVALLPLGSVLAPGPPVEVLTTVDRFYRTIHLARSARRYQSLAARTLAELLRDSLSDNSG